MPDRHSPPDGAPAEDAGITTAAFAPLARSSFRIHRKSPLLVATPPPVTLALSRAYPYLRLANQLAGLLTWTSSDSWASFLLVSAYALAVLYGDAVLQWGGHVFALGVLLALAFVRQQRRRGRRRRSSAAAVVDTGSSDDETTLDEMVATLDILTARVELLASPVLAAADFLAPRNGAVDIAALTVACSRVLLATPLWLALAVFPLRILAPRNLLLTAGVAALAWHSPAGRVSRTLLWRSRRVRAVSEALTGLPFTSAAVPRRPPHVRAAAAAAAHHTAASASSASSSSTPTNPPSPAPSSDTDNAAPTTANETVTATTAGVRFTFSVYENQRRWLGAGWTTSLFAYERAPWTDDHLNPSLPPDEFVLPAAATATGGVRWRWVAAEDWAVDGEHVGGGWWYYDNKWRDGTRGVDGWGKYTRRRKWCRRAELVMEKESKKKGKGKGKEEVKKEGKEGKKEKN